MVDLNGKVAVVTGGARRLGRAIGLKLGEAGCNLVINYRTSSSDAVATAADARAAGVEVVTVQADVAQSDDVERLLQTALTELGRIDVLIANAGAFRRTPLAALSECDWDNMMTDNLRATFLCAHRFGLHMRQHSGGSIITLADVAGLRPWAEYLPYSIAKACVIALTHAMAKELAPSVRVNAIAPGPVLFPANFDPLLQEREVARTLLKRQGNPQDVAEAVLGLVRNEYITGVVLPVDGGRSIA